MRSKGSMAETLISYRHRVTAECFITFEAIEELDNDDVLVHPILQAVVPDARMPEFLRQFEERSGYIVEEI